MPDRPYPSRVKKLSIKNYRSLAHISLDTHEINVFFGPNGAGKSSLLDTIWFLRDCAIRGTDVAGSSRSHGIGLLWDGAQPNETISISLSTDDARYEVNFGFSAGRIEAYAGERLFSIPNNKTLIDRAPGSDKSSFFSIDLNQHTQIELREPEKLCLARYIDFEPLADEAAAIDRLMRFVHFYHSRSFNLYRIRTQGSEMDYRTWLGDRAEDLWAVLRNLHDRRYRDKRYETIIGFMREAFPGFKDLAIEQTGIASVYGSFIDGLRKEPVRASGVSDGHLQLLILLTALFAEGEDRYSLLLLDEPELSLHPWAIAVFAKAVKLAAEQWRKHIFIATHSPVLLSQFQTHHILAAEVRGDRTELRRISDLDGINELLEDYALGSLYMAEAIAPQSFAGISGSAP